MFDEPNISEIIVLLLFPRNQASGLVYSPKPGISVTKKPAIFFLITLRGNVEKEERIEKKGGLETNMPFSVIYFRALLE